MIQMPGAKHVTAAAASFLVAALAAMADPPGLIRYQAKLVDAAGVPITGTHNLTFQIFAQPSGGTPLWIEARTAVDLGASGAADLLLGEVTPLDSSVLIGPDRWLEVTVDASALTPRQRLSSVPFAMVTDRLGTMTLTDVKADVDARIVTHAADADAHREHASLEESAEIDSDVATHSANPNAHHPPTPRSFRFVVDPNGSGDFSDIQSAILATPAVCTASSCGATILLRAGLYELASPIVIDRPQVHLIGAALARIKAVTGTTAQIHLIEITGASGCTIENLDVGGDASARPYKTTVQIQNSSGILLRNNNIDAGVVGFVTITIDAGSREIVLAGNASIGNKPNTMSVTSAGAFVRIENNTFGGNGAGGWITITGTESIISGNSFVQGETIVIEGDRNAVTSNILHGEFISVQGDGNIVANNLVLAHDTAPASGKIIILSPAKDNVLTGNIMLDATGTPTLVQDGGTNTILRGNLGNPDKN